MLRKHLSGNAILLALSIAVLCAGATASIAYAGDLFSDAEQLYSASKYQESAEALTRYLSARQSAQAYELRGLCYFEMGRYEEALEDHNRSLKLNPSKASPYWNRAACFSKMGDHQRAIDDFGRAIVLDPPHADRYYNQRGVEYQTLGDLEKALADFESAERLNPESANYRENKEKLQLEVRRRNRIALAKEVMNKDSADKRQAERIARELARLSGQKIDGSAVEEESDQSSTLANRPIRDKWALVIGVSKFKNPNLNLRYAAKDATDFAAFLTSKGNFSSDHVKVLTDAAATKTRILSELGDKWLPRVAREDDVVVLYFSGHGSASDMDVGGVNYLVAYDTEPDSLFATGLSMQDLVKTLKSRVQAQRIIVVLDACHSGATNASKGIVRLNVDPAEISAGTGQMVISSSKPDERSWEAKDGQNGVFTKHLIRTFEALGPKAKLKEAFDAMRENVRNEVQHDRGASQTPVLSSKWKGDELLLMAAPQIKPAPPVSPSPPASIGPAKVTPAKPSKSR